jgi:hypothetical protein
VRPTQTGTPVQEAIRVNVTVAGRPQVHVLCAAVK